MKINTLHELATAIDLPVKILMKQVNEGQASKISKDGHLTEEEWVKINDTILVKTNLISQLDQQEYIAEQAGKPFNGKIKQNFPHFTPNREKEPDTKRKSISAKKKAKTNTKKTSKQIKSQKKPRRNRKEEIISSLRERTGIDKSTEKYQATSPKRIIEYAKKYYLTSATLIDLLNQYSSDKVKVYKPNTTLTTTESSIVQNFCNAWLEEIKQKRNEKGDKPKRRRIGRHLRSKTSESTFKANYFKLIFITSGNKR